MKKKSIIATAIVATSLLATTALTISHNTYSNTMYKEKLSEWSFKDYEHAIYLSTYSENFRVDSFCVLPKEKETICVATYGRKGEETKYVVKISHEKKTNFLFNVDYVLKAKAFINFNNL